MPASAFRNNRERRAFERACWNNGTFDLKAFNRLMLEREGIAASADPRRLATKGKKSTRGKTGQSR